MIVPQAGYHGETVGRIVHYYEGFETVQAAIIVAVNLDGTADLQVFCSRKTRGTDGSFLRERVPYSEGYKLDHWTWPRKVSDAQATEKTQ